MDAVDLPPSSSLVSRTHPGSSTAPSSPSSRSLFPSHPSARSQIFSSPISIARVRVLACSRPVKGTDLFIVSSPRGGRSSLVPKPGIFLGAQQQQQPTASLERGSWIPSICLSVTTPLGPLSPFLRPGNIVIISSLYLFACLSNTSRGVHSTAHRAWWPLATSVLAGLFLTTLISCQDLQQVHARSLRGQLFVSLPNRRVPGLCHESTVHQRHAVARSSPLPILSLPVSLPAPLGPDLCRLPTAACQPVPLSSRSQAQSRSAQPFLASRACLFSLLPPALRLPPALNLAGSVRSFQKCTHPPCLPLLGRRSPVSHVTWC